MARPKIDEILSETQMTLQTLNMECSVLREVAYCSRNLVRAVEAQKKLDEGFKGMGANICVEYAGSLNHWFRKLKKAFTLLDEYHEIPKVSP